jgi:beta-glucuronidase
MRKYLIALLLVPYFMAQASPVLVNASGRTTFSLNGKWNYIIDPYETGYYDYRREPLGSFGEPASGYFLDKKATDKSDLVEYDFDRSPALNVPGDWNSQDEKLLYYEGTVWYRRLFTYEKKPSSRVFLYFGAANYEAIVSLNGKMLGKHTGGFTPFQFEVTDLLKPGNNSLVVKVDNKRLREGVPTLNTDWWNYGGLTREVMLVEVPETFVADYFIQLSHEKSDRISGTVKLEESAKTGKVKVEIPELQISREFVVNAEGLASIDLDAKKIQRWSPEHPKLYEVVISTEKDVVREKIGFRTLAVSGTDILLNGQPVFLRGICIHEENPVRGGRAWSREDAQLLLNRAKELHCNFVRLAHYPHNEYMARIADEMGIMVWEENPVYWTIQWENESTFQNAENQLTEMIGRDKNRASVIIWSMANETPVVEARNTFLKKLAERTRSLDNTRLISAALEVHGNPADPDERIVEDPFADIVDILSFNQYVGWYDGLPSKCERIRWTIPYQKPVIISEMGGGALQGFHADPLTRWSEEYQEDIYLKSLPVLSKIPQLRGLSPWILNDFRSPRRPLAGIQDGWNRKGLFGQTGTKKKAFYVLKAFYEQKESDQADVK